MKTDLPREMFRIAVPLFLWPALVVAVLFLAGCEEAGKQEAPPRPVRIFELGRQTERPFRRFPGEIKALESTEMAFDVPGRIVEFPAVQGADFTRGGLLARLDPENFEARESAARARLNSTRDELARQRQLRQRGVISQSELDRFVEQFETAEAALREATRALEDTRLVAPSDGRVARVMAANFQSVGAKQPVLLFQDVSLLEVDVHVPESAMTGGGRGITPANAAESIEARVEFPAIPGRSFDLALHSFGTEATPTARTFLVTFRLDPPDDFNILPGMTSTVLLRMKSSALPGEVAAGPEEFLVPVGAVATDSGGASVWKLDPATMAVTRIPVEPLGLEGESMRISSGSLRAGEEIVSTGVRFLSEGARVSRME